MRDRARQLRRGRRVGNGEDVRCEEQRQRHGRRLALELVENLDLGECERIIRYAGRTSAVRADHDVLVHRLVALLAGNRHP